MKKITVVLQGDDAKTILARQNYTIGFNSWGFAFQRQYVYDFVLDAPAGVSLEKSDTSNASLRTLSIGENAPDGATFSVQIKAYAVGHEDEPCYGTPRSFTIYNPPGKDITTDLPGLKRIELLCNGISIEEAALTGGTSYALSFKTDPVDYLSKFNAGVSYLQADGWSSNNVFSIPTTVDDSSPDWFSVSISNDFGGRYFYFPCPTHVPSTTVRSAYNFPGLKNIYLTCHGQQMTRSAGGSFDVEVNYDSDLTYDDAHYLLKVDGTINGTQGVTYAVSSVNGPIHVTVPSSGFTPYNFDSFIVSLYSIYDLNTAFSSAPFYILFAD